MYSLQRIRLFPGNPSGSNPLERNQLNVSVIARVLEGYGANVFVGIQIQDCVFVQISGLKHFLSAKLDIQSIRIFELFYFHGPQNPFVPDYGTIRSKPAGPEVVGGFHLPFLPKH